MNILIIDPDEFWINRLLPRLTAAGITAVHKKTGHAGWFHWDENQSQYDLVMMDMVIFGISGLGLIKLIRHDNPTIPILVVSTRYLERDEAMQLGASAFLTKPVSLDAIIMEITSLIQKANHEGKGQETCSEGE